MSVLADLSQRWAGIPPLSPFLVCRDASYSFSDIAAAGTVDLSGIRRGDVVALIGDFDPGCINTLLRLIDLGAVIVPLARDTRNQHATFFDAAGVDVVIEGANVNRLQSQRNDHPLLDSLRSSGHPGLILFSSGTTGSPKAILHDFENFLIRYRTPRPAQRTMNFLLFDHIGGLNTLFHTLYNCGTVIVPRERSVQAVLEDLARHRVGTLPTTPTFLRMLLLSGALDHGLPPDLGLITYGTERMDPATLKNLCGALPAVDFRQTYGMSEIGILRVTPRGRDNLWMKIGGEGIETRIVGGVLHIRAAHRMIGYLNAASPFDRDGWYDTMDIVEQDGDWLRVVGRANDLINVGGLKIMPEEIERVAYYHPDVAFAKAEGKPNPLTGQHVELTIEARGDSRLDRQELRTFMKQHLTPAQTPHRITIGKLPHNHRFKKM